MTDETHLAFAHPEERAKATALDDISDRISVRDLISDVEIGAFGAERGVTQRIRFNVVVELVAQSGDLEDDVDRILSYDTITEAIEAELSASRLNLLETLAENVADRILIEPLAQRVFVRVEKLDRGPGNLGVEIVRHRNADTSAASLGQEVPRPRVVFVSNEALAARPLSKLLDELSGDDCPLVLCMDLPDLIRQQTASQAMQRRIDLLAIEQNAWHLAGQDNRLVVVGTRTELDWGMKNGQISIWAPSKIVLDAVDDAIAGEVSPQALTVWFAGQMNAVDVAIIADTLTVDASGNVRHLLPLSETLL